MVNVHNNNNDFFLQDGKSVMYNKDNTAKGNARFKGHAVELMDAIAIVAKLKITFYEVKQYGHKDANGTWDGMVKELIDKVRCR